MVSRVVTIEPSASLTGAARAMREANVGMLPVVDAGRVTGIITDRDIVVRGIARAVDVSNTPVGTTCRAR
jgi:CBS domain-containing protein